MPSHKVILNISLWNVSSLVNYPVMGALWHVYRLRNADPELTVGLRPFSGEINKHSEFYNQHSNENKLGINVTKIRFITKRIPQIPRVW